MTTTHTPPRPSRLSRSLRLSRSSRVTTMWAVAGLTLAAFVARLPSLFRQLFDPDEAAIATMGMVVSRGGVLYRDVIDRKPPLAPWLTAAVFDLTGTRDLRFLHLVAAIGLAGAATLVCWEVRRRSSARAAIWAGGLLIAGAVTFGPADAHAANFSHLALLPAAGAIVLARVRGLRAAAGAGLLLGIAVLTRQSWAIGAIPLAYAAWVGNGRRARGPLVALATTVGTVTAVGVVLPFGAFVHWTFTGNGDAMLRTGDLASVVTGLGLFVAGFALGHVALLWLTKRRGWRNEDRDLWLWLATGTAAAFTGARFFGHYWLQVLIPLVLLAAPAIDNCTHRSRRVLAAITLVPLFACWMVAWNPEWLHRRANPDPLVADVVAHTEPNDRIAIWGSFPEIYWKSGRSPSGALVITDFVAGRSAGRDRDDHNPAVVPGARETYIAALRRDPPTLFIDTSTHDLRGYQDYPLREQPEVLAFLHDHGYRPVRVVYGATIWSQSAR